MFILLDTGNTYIYSLDINWHGHYYNINVFITSAINVRWLFRPKLNKLFPFVCEQTTGDNN